MTEALSPPPRRPLRARAESTRVRHVQRFVWLWIAAVLAAGTAFVVHLALRFETVRLGYAASQAQKEHARLLEERRALLLEAETLRQPTRIEQVARQALGMQPADRTRILLIPEPPASRGTR